MKKYLIPFLIAFITLSCSNTSTSQELNNPKLKKVYFTSGFFWYVEAIYESSNTGELDIQKLLK